MEFLLVVIVLAAIFGLFYSIDKYADMVFHRRMHGGTGKCCGKLKKTGKCCDEHKTIMGVPPVVMTDNVTGKPVTLPGKAKVKRKPGPKPGSKRKPNAKKPGPKPKKRKK